MSAEEVLKASERSAVINPNETEIVSRVMGKTNKKHGHKSLGALGLIALMVIVMSILMSFGNFIPAAISERLIEATDIQYADAVESKLLVFQQALESGDIPENTVKRLEGQEIIVNGNSLEFKGKTITATNLNDVAHSDVAFYNAIMAATYDRAAYFYDEPAEEVFRKIGTTRDNYTKNSEFDEIMSKLVGEGSSVNVSNVGLVEKTYDEG